MKKYRALLLILIVALTLPSAAFATVESVTISSQLGDLVKGPIFAYAPLGDPTWDSASQTPGVDAAFWKYPLFGAAYISDLYRPISAHWNINTWRLYHKEFTVGCANASGVLQVNSDNAEEAYLNGVLIGIDGWVNSTSVPTWCASGCDFTNFEWEVVKTYNVNLQPGANTLDFIVRNYPQTNENPTALAYKLEYSCPSTTAPDLTITQIADQAVVSTGDPIGFTITVTNNGNATANIVTLSNPLPVYSELDWLIGGTDASACLFSDGIVYCNFQDIDPGEVKTIRLTSPTRFLGGKGFCPEITSTATLMAYNQPVNKTATASVQIQCPSINLSIASDASSVTAGSPIGFTITITNAGEGIARDVDAYIELPNKSGLSWSIASVTPTSADGNCAIDIDGTSIRLACLFDQMVPLEEVIIGVTSSTTKDSCGTLAAAGSVSCSNGGGIKGQTAEIVVNCSANDTTPPVISPTITGTQGANGWYTDNVLLTWSVSDPESALSSTSGCESVTITKDQAATNYTCSATSAGGTTSETVSIARDATAPIITCPASTQVSEGQTVTANVDAAISGLDAAESTLSGILGSVFPQTLSFTAVDLAGNTTTKACTFNTGYNFSGFYQPVENPGPGPNYVFNSLKAGVAVPVRFSLSGDQSLNIFASGYPVSLPASCSITATTDPIEQTVTAGNSSLSYDALSDTYTYIWKTDKKWAGTCRVLNLKFNDGNEYGAYFQFK
jgi:uncharacterized repeat protein (TIGR01451 family)